MKEQLRIVLQDAEDHVYHLLDEPAYKQKIDGDVQNVLLRVYEDIKVVLRSTK